MGPNWAPKQLAACLAQGKGLSLFFHLTREQLRQAIGMRTRIELKLLPEFAHDPEILRREALALAKVSDDAEVSLTVVRRSIDARSKQPYYILSVEISVGEQEEPLPKYRSRLKQVGSSRSVVIVGAGPAGYFAALELIEAGIKPIVIERGPDVRERRKDLKAIQQHDIVNPHSNYCFGEGGAGTYSDGKLYTRSHKRGDISKVLTLLVEHGAAHDILIDTHPHIGSNKLPGVVSQIRETILACGGEVHFNSHVTDLVLENKKLRGVIVHDSIEYNADAVVLATGHSARDIYYLLKRRGVRLEAKPFAMGLRIEHPQSLIDQIQYHQPRGEYLPAASYKLVTHGDSRGVYSFCMCPGGLIVPASTAPGEIVVNGMSMSKRDSKFANSGIVVEIRAEDFERFAAAGELAGLALQQEIEQLSFKIAGGTQQAPAQRVVDFCEGRASSDLPPTSYIPGLTNAPLHQLLPAYLGLPLQNALQDFGKKMRGYYTNEAIVVATESRTSSPIKIPRDLQTLAHPDIQGLYPAGEGGGFAGGIVSAALDGQRVALALAEQLQSAPG